MFLLLLLLNFRISEYDLNSKIVHCESGNRNNNQIVGESEEADRHKKNIIF